jgi:hypothetical protein
MFGEGKETQRVFSIHVRIWNIKTCLSHFKKGKREEREQWRG